MPSARIRALVGLWVLVSTSLVPATDASQHERTIGIIGAFDHMPITYRVQAGTKVPARLVEIAHMALNAWEQSVHEYAADGPSSAHLVGFDLAPAPSGRPADVDVILGATGGVIGGVGGPSVLLLDRRIVHAFAYTPALFVGSCWDELCAGVSGSNSGPIGTFLPPAMDEPSFYFITMHEIGHALGLSHGDAGTMYPAGRISSGSAKVSDYCFSQLELEGLARSYGWLATGSFVSPPTSVTIEPTLVECVSPMPAPPSTPLVEFDDHA